MSVAVRKSESRCSARLARARAIIKCEIDALQQVCDQLNADQLDRVVELILDCEGCILMCGIGKAGLVAQKISASLASKGTPSHFLHPSEAVHGDLGKIRPEDIVVFLSYSGETTEVTSLLKTVNSRVSATIALTREASSTLAQGVDAPLLIGQHQEACVHGLAPTTSTAVMMAVGDALTLIVSEYREFTRQNFKEFHPGGSLGRNLCEVDEIMRPLQQCRVARDSITVGEVFVQSSLPGRRTGAIMLLDAAQRLTGIFTDSDLARRLEANGPSCLSTPIADVMTKDFSTVRSSSMLMDALQVMTSLKLSELPVLDNQGRPVGLIDITDILDTASSTTEEPSRSDPSILPFVHPETA